MTNNPNSMVTRWSITMQELDFMIHFVPGSQSKWADTLSRLCPNLKELAMDYTPRVMDAPDFIVAAITTCPLASEEESEWMEQAHNFRVGHGGVDRTMHTWPHGPFLAVHAKPRSVIRTVLSMLPEDECSTHSNQRTEVHNSG
jgi:hypothetical protein